jgi:superfamily II DNA or RNA helicase
VTTFVDPAFLVEERPRGFVRQIERLLATLEFADVVNIDGSGDKGADLIARLRGDDWVFQCKWKQSAAVDVDAVEEVWVAMQHYGVERGVVVTNRDYTKKARDRAAALAQVGVNILLWTGNDLRRLFHNAHTRIPPFELHGYQQRAVDHAYAAMEENSRALVYLATGLGKTVVAGRVLTRYLAHNPAAEVLVVAHQTDLVEQLERSMWRDIPKDIPTRLLGGKAKPQALPGVTFGVLPTARDYVESGYRPSLVVVDEAHHVAETGHYAAIFAHLPDALRLGVTATPWRGDRFDIEGVFGEPVVRVSISEGMRLGYLADVRYQLFTDNIDWDFVREHSDHDYSIKDLNKRLFVPERDEAVRDHLIETWGAATNPRAIVFCQTIEHAERMAELLGAVPGWQNTVALHAELNPRERRSRLLRFRSGDVPILTAVDILNEGVDVPDVNILCFARVTHSRRIFVQQLGRGLRLRHGKTHVQVLDFVSDIRRLAEVYELRQQVNESEIETVSVPKSQFVFTDERASSLMQQWLSDVGDLAGVDETVRLEFPPMEGL